jgi:pimeloyl-ACP methyl ester carboxylesterase/DNA-binding CsgD family transcriptional regulator
MGNDNEKDLAKSAKIPMAYRGKKTKKFNNASLDLLEAIADVGNQPERFSEVCHDWAVRPDEAEELQSFEVLLNAVYVRNSEHFESLNSDYFSNSRPISGDEHQNSFVINLNSEIVSIGENAQNVLGISQGENANELFVRSLDHLILNAASSKNKGLFSDIFGRDGARHFVSMMMVNLPDEEDDFVRVTLRKIELSSEAEKYIRQNLVLTNAEIDVLRHILQRMTIVAISEQRGCTENTTRTHINSIKRKFSSRSLTDVISSTHEIIAFHGQDRDAPVDYPDQYTPVHNNSTSSRLSTGSHQVEYSRYGDPSGRALMMLHSIEYGIEPPKAFIAEAQKCGYCLYVPLRPGFGRSTPAGSTTRAAIVLNNFVQALKLSDVTVVALSTSAPTALKLLEFSKRIEKTILVNYAFNTENKMENISPVWIKGLLKFGIGSNESFNFAFRMVKGMLKILGYKTFYRKLYQTCDEDLKYLDDNSNSFAASAKLILSADAEACRSDIVSAFAPNTWVENTVGDHHNLISVFGEHTHGLELSPIRESMQRLGVPFSIIENTGRSCIYQNPARFFQIIDQDFQAKAAS